MYVQSGFPGKSSILSWRRCFRRTQDCLPRGVLPASLVGCLIQGKTQMTRSALGSRPTPASGAVSHRAAGVRALRLFGSLRFLVGRCPPELVCGDGWLAVTESDAAQNT